MVDVMPALATVVAAAGGVAAVLGVVAGRLTGSRRPTWLGVSLGVYGLVVVPLSTAPAIGSVLASSPGTVAWAASVWSGTAFAAALPDSRGRAREAWAYAASTGLLGAVHAIGGTGLPGTVLAGLRVVVVALLLASAVALVRAALARLDDAHDRLEEELRLAELVSARVAERDHELRNGLAGLAGAVRVLGSDRAENEPLDGLVASELRRLDDLLEATVAPLPRPPSTVYDVEPLLSGLVVLRRAAGTEVDLEAEPGLRAVGSPATLAQVVVNLIGNAERHAPGSPVRITALRRDDRVVVLVRDLGPGVPPGQEKAVFEPGVRDRRRDGRGLGLHVCRELLAAEDASIAVLANGPEARGCAILVDLPSSTSGHATPRAAPAGVPSSLS